MTEHPIVALVGGLLGAGKTTLLLKAAALLRERGLRVAIITNDQGGALVDTRLAAAAGLDAEEIAGGCFCCRFSDFLSAAEHLRAYAPDVIFAEPVGSCMDVSATVLQPIKRLYADRFRLAPFTVLVDPQRARELLQPGADPYLVYLFRNQLAEADLVWFSKADLCTEFPEIPGGAHGRMSAVSGEGVSEWLAGILAGGPAGSRLLDIDDAEYAEAEAALGWVNWHARLRLRRPLTPAAVVGPLLERLDQALTRAGAAIAHLKIFNQAPTGWIRASICRNSEEPTVDGDLAASPALEHELVLNLRARAAPQALEQLVERAAAELPGRAFVLRFDAFSPPPPTPERRLT